MTDLEIVRVGPGFIVMRDARKVAGPFKSQAAAAPRGASGNAGGNRRLMPVPCVPAEVAAMA
jgi:hypothetical protein